jgi:hypothetical protein
MAGADGFTLRRAERLLSFLGKPINVHSVPPSHHRIACARRLRSAWFSRGRPAL